MLTLQHLSQQLLDRADRLQFGEVVELIDAHYSYTPTAFTNGSLRNPAGINAGSCKVLFFAQLVGLNEQETLACFGEHYRDVLADPDGDSHQNIRNFMTTGWSGVVFAGSPLREKAVA